MQLGNLAEKFKEWWSTQESQEQGQTQGQTQEAPLHPHQDPQWWSKPAKAPSKWVAGPFFHNRASNRARVFGSALVRRDARLHAAYRAYIQNAHQRDLNKLAPPVPLFTGGILHQHQSPPTFMERQHAG